jgi:hypothetical protein
MKIVIKFLFVFVIFFISACDDEDCAPVLETSHSGWKDNDCIECHTGDDPDGAAIPHEIYPIPECASCHGANGACARPQVTWHPAESCSEYNCHGAMHTFTEPSDCGNCHFASAGVFQCTIYH